MCDKTQRKDKTGKERVGNLRDWRQYCISRSIGRTISRTFHWLNTANVGCFARSLFNKLSTNSSLYSLIELSETIASI